MDPRKIIFPENLTDSNGTAFNPLDSLGGVNSIFTGVDDMVNLNLNPYVTGYSFIYWVDLPAWFNKDPDLKYYKEMSQKNFKNFSGVDNITLNTVDQQVGGFTGAPAAFAGNIEKGNTEFSINHKEYSGGVMRKMYQKWISYIRDPRTGIALYPKLFNVDYTAKNHTGQLLYIVTRPDVTNTSKNIVEYAAFYSNVMPTNIPYDALYNYEMGSQESPEITISFKGFMENGPDVEAYAKQVLAQKIMSPEGDSYLPFVDSLGTNPDANAAFKSGTLKDIFKAPSAE
jgi:hypothetical protein